MAGVIASKTGYYLLYVFLFTVAVVYVASFTQPERDYVFKLGDVEDGVVANRVIRCFSEENNFGVIDVAKFDINTLKKCFGESKYNLRIKLNRKKGQIIEPLEMGNLDEVRIIRRYVLMDEGGKYGAVRLEIGYNKNAA